MFAFVESFLALLNVLTPARPWGTEIYPACFNNICNQNYWLQCWQKKGRALPASTTFAIKISGCKAGQKKGRALPASTTFAIKITDCNDGQKKGRVLPASTTFAFEISGCNAGQKKGRALPASTTFAIKITDCKAGQKKRACSACFDIVCDQNY